MMIFDQNTVVQLHLSPNPILLKRVHLVQLVILEEPQSEDPSGRPGRPRDNMSIFINILLLKNSH
jgi:hypothetical protein